MTDRQLNRLLTILGITMFFFGVAIISLMLRDYPHTNNTYVQDTPRIERLESDLVEVKQRLAAGPREGKTGKDGVDGKNVQTTIVERNTTTVTKSVPVKGDKGEDGRSPELRKNPKTGDIEQRYKGDGVWKILIRSCELLGHSCVESEHD